MKEVFDINRFGKLFRYDFSVNRWEYILLLPISILVLWSVLFIGMSKAIGGNYPAGNYSSMFFIGYFILGIFLNTKSYGALKNRLSAASYLTLPASTFEKYFLHWFFRIAMFSLLYPIVFYLGVNLFIPIFKTGVAFYLDYKGSNAAVPQIAPFEFNLVKPDTGRFFGNFSIYFGLIFTLTLVQLGSIAFGKWNLLKTFLVLIGIMVLLYYYTKLIGAFKGGLERLRPTFFNDGLPDQISMLEISLLALMVITLLICWTATFLKLKEREV